MSLQKLSDSLILFIHSYTLHIDNLSSLQVGKNINCWFTGAILIDGSITFYTLVDLDIEKLIIFTREAMCDITVVFLGWAWVDDGFWVILDSVDKVLFILWDGDFFSGQKFVEIL